MPFVHEDQEFNDLLQIASDHFEMPVELVEKDYWVTHALWALRQQGFEIWLKGGTSLSKGFELITRFSEDLDLKLEPGSVQGLPAVSSWGSNSATAIASRKAYFETLAQVIDIKGVTAILPTALDDRWHRPELHVQYPGSFLDQLPPPMRPFVLLEPGNARVTPFLERDMTSFVHGALEKAGQLDEFEDNRPRAVRCVHPFVTLLEKIDALQKHAIGDARQPADFVRHYEDAAWIIDGVPDLPPIDGFEDVRALASEMLEARDIRQLAEPADPAFNPGDSVRWTAIAAGYEQIAPMFWGERIPLKEACAQIRDWLMTNLD